MSWPNRVLDMQTNGRSCPVWIETRDARCKRTDLIDGRWCRRHTPIILRRLQTQRDTDTANAARRDAALAAALPDLRTRLARVEAQIARLDPPPPTTDSAAYGGVGSTTATRYQQRFFRNLPRLTQLWDEQRHLADTVRRAERAAERQSDRMAREGVQE